MRTGRDVYIRKRTILMVMVVNKVQVRINFILLLYSGNFWLVPRIRTFLVTIPMKMVLGIIHGQNV